MVTEQKNEMVFDGDGRPVLEKTAIRGYHGNNPPSTTLTTTPRMYQVWSSVLGQSMTTILPNGTKYETNVFAGGAVIAKNNINGVGWKTADPVTGTVGYVGTSAGTVEEFEPLGQKLHLTDPEPLPDPVPTESVYNKADYPQWMCEPSHAYLYYGEFHEWPEPCQSKYRNEMSIVPITITEKKESPQKIPTGTDSPIPGGNDSDRGATYAANYSRTFALSSTAKKIGSIGGDGQCPKDANGRPKAPCDSQYEPTEITIPEFSDASQSGDGNYNPQFVFSLQAEQDLANRIVEIANFARDSKACADAFRALGATPINEQMRNTTVVTENALNEQRLDSQWTRGNNEIAPFLRSIIAANPNTADATPVGEYRDTGRRFIGLTNAGINESVDYLDAVIIHSFIHSGGIDGRKTKNNWKDYLFGNDPEGYSTRHTPSDLHYRGDQYDAALDACIKGAKKTKTARAEPYGIPTN